MPDIKKFIQIIAESSTASGSVSAAPGKVGKSPLKRPADTIFAAEDCEPTPSSTVVSPSNFGLWGNSAKIGKEQDGKHGRKKMTVDLAGTEMYPQLSESQQGVAEGLSKRDQKDVDSIKAAIERLEAQLKQPNADKDDIQQSIAHEKKRLKLYPQSVTEGSLNESDKFTSWYDWKDQAKSSGYTITKKDGKIVALNKQGQVVGHWSDVGKFLSGKAPRPNFKRQVEQDVAEAAGRAFKPGDSRPKQNPETDIIKLTKDPERIRQANLLFRGSKPEDKKPSVAESPETQKTFTVVYYSPKTDRNVTKTMKAVSKSDIWDKLENKGIKIVSVTEKGVADKEIDEARMSAHERLAKAMDRQRTKSDASLRRTPSSIPKAEPKKDEKKVAQGSLKESEPGYEQGFADPRAPKLGGRTDPAADESRPHHSNNDDDYAKLVKRYLSVMRNNMTPEYKESEFNYLLTGLQDGDITSSELESEIRSAKQK